MQLKSLVIKLRVKYSDWGSLNDEQKKKARNEWYGLSEKYPQKKATVADAVDHIDHIVKTIGIDHVGIGTDFDGGGSLRDCKDVSELPNITLELLRRNYSKKDIRKIWSENFLRVFKEVRDNSKI